jgi:hypothetical protein
MTTYGKVRSGRVWCGEVWSGAVRFGKVRCGMEYKRNRRQLLKELSIEFIGGKVCNRCGCNFLPISAYDFHHNTGAKEINISQLLNTKKTLDDELKEELKKCILLCANCHRIVTHDKL